MPKPRRLEANPGKREVGRTKPRLLTRTAMRASVLLVSCVLLSAGVSACAAAHRTSSQRLVDAARELNEASRFGRMDVAADLAARGAETSFLERRRTWGNDVRVVDVNVASVEFADQFSAEVMVQIAWTHMAQGTLNNTTLKQSWEDRKHEGWKLTREQRVEGAQGLFGEAASQPHPQPRPDVHFPSKTLSSSDPVGQVR